MLSPKSQGRVTVMSGKWKVLCAVVKLPPFCKDVPVTGTGNGWGMPKACIHERAIGDKRIWIWESSSQTINEW